MSTIKSSELITNDDGSIFHLHLLPEDLADTVILVGDPGRVETISAYFDTIELKKVTGNFIPLPAVTTIAGYRLSPPESVRTTSTLSSMNWMPWSISTSRPRRSNLINTVSTLYVSALPAPFKPIYL